MALEVHRERIATAAAEEILRLIYGDDLEGCTVRLDSISTVIETALEEYGNMDAELTELQAKALEAIQLLSTPPPDGNALSAEELRSLLGERLDKIRTLSTRVVQATNANANELRDDSSL